VEDIIDFSANINPFGPAPGVRQALARVHVDRYPDPGTLGLRRALAEHLNVAPGQILAGNGASELIWLTALAYVRPRDRVLVLGPTYAEYTRAVELMGGRVLTVLATEEDRFAVNSSAVSRALDEFQPRLAFVCNPNNPTGAVIARAVIAAWARRHPQTVFVVDEAYLPLPSGLDSVIDLGAPNVLVLRSMTKDFGLAGLRLGYALGKEELIGWLGQARPPWSVSAVAQEAGVAAFADTSYYRGTRAAVERAKAGLVCGLKTIALDPLPSATPFFLIRVGDGAAFRDVLLRRKMLVRDCASFGLPNYVRIATRRPEENARLLDEIRQLHWPREARHAG
jgi:threonine-phosphate decarboxylase